MKYVSRELKGTFGYIKKQTVFEIIKTVFLFAMAFGIFAIGYFTLGTKKSLWSVFAVLALLPASKSMVSMIMFLRYKSIDESLYQKVLKAAENIPTLFELVVTTKDKTYFVDCVSYMKGTLIAYTSSKDVKDIIALHFVNVLNNGGHKGVTVKIYDEEDDYLNRLKEIEEHFGEQNQSAKTDAVFTTLKAVSL